MIYKIEWIFSRKLILSHFDREILILIFSVKFRLILCLLKIIPSLVFSVIKIPAKLKYSFLIKEVHQLCVCFEN